MLMTEIVTDIVIQSFFCLKKKKKIKVDLLSFLLEQWLTQNSSGDFNRRKVSRIHLNKARDSS